MNKNFWESKTLWGFGIAALVVLAQTFGLVDSNVLTETIKTLSGLFGVYGLRDSIA